MIKRLILSISLVLVMCFTFILNTNSIEVKAESEEVRLSIYKNNLSYSSEIYFLYSLQYENIDIEKNSIELLFWDSVQEEYLKGTESYSKKSVALEEIDEKMCLVYYSEGIDAKNIIDDIYTRAYVKIDEVEYYSEVDVTSVVEYVYRMKKTGELSDTLNNLFDSLLDYGAAAQLQFEYKTEMLANELIKEVKVVNGLVNEKESDVFYQDYNATIKALDKTSEGLLFKYWTDSEGNIVSYESEYSFEVLENETYTANYIEASKVSETLEIKKDISYDATKGMIDLPIAVIVEKDNKTYVLSVEWDINNFNENVIGEQTFYASLVDYSLYEEFGISEGDIKVILNVSPYSFNLDDETKTYVITGYYGNDSDITIPSIINNINVSEISKNAFSQNAILENVIVSDGITNIGYGAFFECGSLTCVELPNSIITLDNAIFFNCSKLTNVNIPSAVETIPQSMFFGCSSLETIVIPEGVKYINKTAFSYCKSLKEISIPASVIVIGDNAFMENPMLSSVTFEEGSQLTNINYAAFSECGALESITIPSSVVEIGDNAFQYCYKLNTIEFDENANIEKIGIYAFIDCSSITEITIPSSLKEIGNYAFYRCTALKEINFEDNSNLLVIGFDAFNRCSSLLNIVIPRGVETISIRTFAYCSSLKTITIPNTVTKIDVGAFIECIELDTVYFDGTIDEWDNITFVNETSNPRYYASNFYTKDSNGELVLNAYTITYVLQNGQTAAELVKHYTKDTSTIILPDASQMTIENGEFVGWYTNPSGAGEALTEISQGTVGNLILYACWLMDEVKTITLSEEENNLISKYAPTKFVFENASNCKYLINDVEYKYGFDIFNNLDDAIVDASEGETIYVFAGAYTLSTNITKSITIVGPNAEKESTSVRSNQAIITVRENLIKLSGANITFDGLDLIGREKAYNSGVYFATDNGLEVLTMENCLIRQGNTFIKTVAGSDVSINVFDCRISEVGQFFIWTLAGTTKETNVRGCYFVGIDSGSVDNTNAAMIRVISGDAYIYNNTFVGDTLATNGGYFCNRGTGVYEVKYNTFIDVTKFICFSSSTNHIFDCNLYITNDQVALVSPVGGSGVKADITVSTSSEDLATRWGNYVLCYENNIHDEIEHEGKDATCTETGYKAYVTCSRCDYTTYEVIDALGHDEIEHEGKDATCTETGNKAYVTCTRCDYSTYEVIAALGHDEVEHEGKDATCTESGHNAYVTCTRCDYSTYEEIEALGHEEVEHEGKAATCTESGHNAYVTCTRCDYSTYEEIEVLGHKYSKEWTIDQKATETSIGLKSHHCKNEGCESKIDITEIPMLPYSDGLEYELNSTSDGYIVKGRGSCYDSIIKITPVYKGLPVVKIGDEAFSEYWLLSKIIIPSSVESIGYGAFASCDALKTVTIQDGLINIGDYAFRDCKALASITIPSSVESVGKGAFIRCTSLESATIQEGVISIGESAFASCESLINITIPSSVESIGYAAFFRCISLENLTIQEGVISIGDGVFRDCTALASITIPLSVENIGELAFSYCKSLTNITIPSSVESIGEDAFFYCKSLTSVYYNGTIADWCNITFSNNYSNPMCYASRFYMLDDDNKYYIFKEITIPSHLESIGSYTFYGFKSITNITIPSSVESIGNYAFYECESLTRVYYNGTIADWCNITFSTSSSNPMSYASQFYMLDDNDEYYLVKEVTMPSHLESIGSYTFYGFKSITNIIIPSSVTSIGNYAFYECESLTSIEIPSSVTSIGDSAFYSCESLTSIEIPSSVTTIGDSAFYSCGSLTSIEIPSSVTAIGNSAFGFCTSLASIEIPSSVTTIGNYAFRACALLTSIEIPSSVTTIGNSAFEYCASLTSIEIPSSVTVIGKYAFDSCTSLTSVYYSGTVEEANNISLSTKFEDTVTIYYYSETEPSVEGNYWYYDENRQIKVWG